MMMMMMMPMMMMIIIIVVEYKVHLLSGWSTIFQLLLLLLELVLECTQFELVQPVHKVQIIESDLALDNFLSVSQNEIKCE